MEGGGETWRERAEISVSSSGPTRRCEVGQNQQGRGEEEEKGRGGVRGWEDTHARTHAARTRQIRNSITASK